MQPKSWVTVAGHRPRAASRCTATGCCRRWSCLRDRARLICVWSFFCAAAASARAPARRRPCCAAMLGVGRASARPSAWRRASASGSSWALAALSAARLCVERALLGRRLVAQVVGPRARVRRSSGGATASVCLVDGDLVGERLVLLADVDVVAHLGQQVGERPARQERLEERGPVGVVGAPDALGEERLALGELGRAWRPPGPRRRPAAQSRLCELRRPGRRSRPGSTLILACIAAILILTAARSALMPSSWSVVFVIVLRPRSAWSALSWAICGLLGRDCPS